MFIFIFIVCLCLLGYAIFCSKNQLVGKSLYSLNNKIEASLAGLSKTHAIDKGNQYHFLSNNKVDKPLLVLLHGFSADKIIWQKFAKHAKTDYFVVIPDFLGHGDNPYDPSQTYSSIKQAQYICELLKYLKKTFGHTSCSIIGNSMGGMVCIDLINKVDDLEFTADFISDIVLLDPAGAKSEFAINASNLKINPFVHENENSVLEFYSQVMHKPPFMPPSVISYVASELYLAKSRQYLHMFHDFFDISNFYDENIDTSSVNVLLIWGQKDGLLPVADAKLWSRLLNVESIIFDEIGHMPMVECPTKTYQFVHKFLSEG